LSAEVRKGLGIERGVFVTLRKHGELRGCIGSIVGRRPLLEAVVESGGNAAVRDSRFPPVRPAELAGLELEVSVLTPLRTVPGPEAVEPGRHGVLLESGGRSAVFLPQVATEQGWDRETLLTHLALKAGLPPDAWRHGASLQVFAAEVF
jgi:AmmeMemoRadiSam system protein A